MRSELKLGERPRVVLIDYIQLVAGSGENRREKISNIAEDERHRKNIVCAHPVLGFKLADRINVAQTIIVLKRFRQDGFGNALSLRELFVADL